eukprot:11567314-Alexandrium_andersonii.AAC.1
MSVVTTFGRPFFGQAGRPRGLMAPPTNSSMSVWTSCANLSAKPSMPIGTDRPNSTAFSAAMSSCWS